MDTDFDMLPLATVYKNHEHKKEHAKSSIPQYIGKHGVMQVGLPHWYKMVYYQQQEGTALLFQIQKVKRHWQEHK